MVFTDLGHRLADRTGYGGSSAFGRGRSSSVATSETERGCELSNEEVAFGLCLGESLGVADGARLLDVVVDLRDAPAVGVPGSGVEDLARITECRVPSAAGWPPGRGRHENPGASQRR